MESHFEEETMALQFTDPKAEELARELATITGETISEAVLNALRERIGRIRKSRDTSEELLADIMEISERCAALPDLDTRSPDEIIGYNSGGFLD
ncbi:MAG: type II toxin-antitoxin system VapB family antitoxin [Desulfococcaceae bacterium]